MGYVCRRPADWAIRPFHRSTFVTVGRAKVVNFTRPISYTGNTALVRSNDKRFSKLSDLDAKGVSYQRTQ
jgi:ABC-type amino acid transport substrate-binding protein